MDLTEFHYELPEDLIAHFPAKERSGSRLLCLNSKSGEISHHQFPDLLAFLRPNDLLVFNDTKVIPARFFGEKESGGKIEVLIERVLGNNGLLVQIKASKSPQPGTKLYLYKKGTEQINSVLGAVVTERAEGFFTLQFDPQLNLASELFPHGYIPLPPYIKREEELVDQSRYQTVYANKEGAVAAPTAGLHFDQALMRSIRKLGAEISFLTLHVGAGTFQPVRVANIAEHKMHKELVEIETETCEKIKKCKETGGRVIAIGTTSVRALEAVAQCGKLEAMSIETDIFIYPGFEFKVVDALVTNFHLPQSTLLMLVSALSSKRMILDAYSKAIEERYRFFSYGDAMLIY